MAPNTAASESVKADACVDILMRQCKHLNNIVEQDHWTIKRITRAVFGFKSFWSARIIIAGIETMHMIHKGQMDCPEGQNHVCRQPVLQPCSSISNSATQLFWARLNYCDRPNKAPN